MSRLDQFNALMSYIEENPQILAEHGEKGTQILRQIEEACLVQDAEALSDGIDEFISLFMGDQILRGLAPASSQKPIEQFNSIRKATRSVLDKMEE